MIPTYTIAHALIRRLVLIGQHTHQDLSLFADIPLVSMQCLLYASWYVCSALNFPAVCSNIHKLPVFEATQERPRTAYRLEILLNFKGL